MKNNQTEKVTNSLAELALQLNRPDLAPLSQPGTMMISNRYSFVSNNRLLLAEMYAEHGIVQTFVDLPVDDALRGGVDIRTGQLSTEDVEELQKLADKTYALETFAQAKKWARLFGGGAVLIITDQDPTTPLQALKKGDRVAFKAVDMWELYSDGVSYKADAQNNLQFADNMGMLEQTEYFSYYGVKVHRSRLVILKGQEAPSLLRNRMRGWGVSVCEAIVRSINEYLKAKNLSYEVLDEFKVDVYKIKNLITSLSSASGTNLVARRIETSNMMKNYNNSIVMDAEDDYQNKQLSFSGLSEMLGEIRLTLAADLRMPITKLFGVSSTGGAFATSENDLENYNAMVEGTIRAKIKRDYEKMLEVLCQSLFGFVPDDLDISFFPLKIMSEAEQENIKDKKFARLMSAFDKGIISDEECKQAINKDDLLGMEISEKAGLFKPFQEPTEGLDIDKLGNSTGRIAHIYKPTVWQKLKSKFNK